MTDNNGFSKTERLSAAKVIDELFQNGKRFNNHPIRVIWKLSDKEDRQRVKILISVPKKYLAKAVDRNLIKRRIREAYRKNKILLTSDLAEKTTKSIDIAIIFAGKNIIGYTELENKVISAFHKLSEFIKIST